MDDPFDGNEVTVECEDIEENYVPAKPPVKKKKYRGCSEQGETVKKPRSAYLLYYYDIYLKVQQEVPHLPQSEINKKISESWKLLSVAEKSYYLERAKLEKEGLDSNINSSSSTMISDVPGFRKILPRSEYILIPKRIPDDEPQRVDICLSQPRETAVLAPSATLSHNGGQSFFTLDPGQINLSEQMSEVDGLTEEGASFSPDGTVQDVAHGGLYTQLSEKLAGEIILNEATLEIGDTSTYPGANVVIEEDGGIALTQSEMSVLTVMAIQETDESCTAPPASQYIMMPVTSRSLTESSRTIKLATTYTRRGRGNCTNPNCTFSYVTRHKPPKCPVCNQFLGGKWIPKGKLPKEKGPVSLKSAAPPSDSSDVQAAISASESRATQKENTEAVSHILQATPLAQTEEWEEVIISDSHFVAEDNDEAQGSGQAENAQVAERDANKTEKPPATGRSKGSSQASSSKTQPPSSSSAPKAESKCAAKPLAAASKPIRAILPAPASASRGVSIESAGNTLTILKPDAHNLISSTGLKASTLKQLGQVVLQQPVTQDITVRTDLQAPAPQPQLKVVTDSFPPYKYSCPMPLDLGLATQRGRGKCKNPFCNFMYTNRHKPKTCPNCGFSLIKDKIEKEIRSESPICISADLSVRESLTQSQKEVQRQSTLQLIRKSVQIPENESELSETFSLIQELNSSRLVLSDVSDGTVTIEQTSWASVYESPSDHCLLCETQLYKSDKKSSNSAAGAQDCWLLTATRLQPVTAQVKVCLNPQCLALHSFSDIYTGLFNVGNRLLVSIDLLFSIRNQIKIGEDPKMTISNILESVQSETEKVLSSEELLALQELLSCGYWAFECLTLRDFNDMICGVCGVAPKVEIAQRNVENTLTLTNIEFTWPEFLTTNEVSMEDFWSMLENEVLEQAAFPSSIPITKFDASILSPFFPPLMRGAGVVNSESYKNLEINRVVGNGSALARLLREGTLKLDDLNQLRTEELQETLTLCGIPWGVTDTKDNMCYSILALSEFVQNGTQIRQPPAHLTGGKLYKVCPHQVVCGSKYIVRGESPRDHVDLLASSRHWPPVYVVDMATQVALCADLCHPDLTQQMWGKNQGCFSDPSAAPKYVSCPELLDIHYSVDMMGNDSSILHPVTKSESRRIVHVVAEQNGASDPTARHHSLSLCREMEPYSAIISAIGDSKTSVTRHHPINFDNITHYYLYNRLIDFLTSREIVNRQIHDIVQSCQPGEVVIRDTLYRLGVAQIRTELEDSVLEEDVLLEQPSSV